MTHLRNKIRVVREGRVVRVYKLDEAGMLTPRYVELGIQIHTIGDALVRLWGGAAVTATSISRDWSKVDWSVSDVALAAQTGMTVPNIRYHRKKQSPETATTQRSGPKVKVTAASFPGTDWNISAWDIKEALGVSYHIAKRLKAEGLGNAQVSE